MNDYEAKRLENIKRNQALIRHLGIPKIEKTRPPPAKKRKVELPAPRPSRSSARLASAPSRPSYSEDALASSSATAASQSRRPPGKKAKLTTSNEVKHDDDDIKIKAKTPSPPPDLASIRANWSSWTINAPPPTRDNVTGIFHFASHPDFLPNKSPEEVLREGAFGGSYFRPLYSRTLATTITNDHLTTLHPTWHASLPTHTHLTSPTYTPTLNKFAVPCGQSIEEWEAAGWINHAHDPRGWFQWYCRFFRGRRLPDGEDERQVGRWRRCVGKTGRWRRLLLKKYGERGVRTVWEDEGDEAVEVSPVMHQTCHHWAWEVRQGVLDEWWEGG